MRLHHFHPLLPSRINSGSWVAGFALPELKKRIASSRIVLPICSLGTSPEKLAELAPLVLPPLYHEALDTALKSDLVAQIRRCFPFFEGSGARAGFSGEIDVMELPARRPSLPARPPRILAFGVDTTVEQHGPHLPLGTDTIQSYAVLDRLASEVEGFQIGPPLEYGQLTWGLPFGMSIDVTAPLLIRYMTGFVNALIDWLSPGAIYVVDVHGSLVHRGAVQDGLRRSRCACWSFRWLHEPLVEFGFERGDAHAGGVETTLVAHINSDLVDPAWWPGRADELAAGQMPVAEAVRLSPDLPRFVAEVESGQKNGIVGDLHNAATLDAGVMMDRMLAIARADVHALGGKQSAG